MQPVPNLTTTMTMILTPRLCRAARAGLNWTQGDLAKRAVISTSTVNDFEREISKPHTTTLEELRRVLTEAGVHFVSKRTLTFREQA
jgi:transcriptional regulator with XRE-family HTH domain